MNGKDIKNHICNLYMTSFWPGIKKEAALIWDGFNKTVNRVRLFHNEFIGGLFITYSHCTEINAGSEVAAIDCKSVQS